MTYWVNRLLAGCGVVCLFLGPLSVAAWAQDPAAVDRDVPGDFSPVFDIPKVSGLEINGKLADWGDRGFRVDVLSDTANRVRPKASFDGAFRLGWDDRGLLVFVTVTDNIPSETENPFRGGDSVVLFISPHVGSEDMIQVGISPGLDAAYPRMRVQVYDAEGKSDASLHVVTARQKTGDGYVLEVLVPWESLHMAPTLGRELGMQVQITDCDSAAIASQLLWYPSVRTPKDKTRLHRIRLSDRASEPVRAAVYASFLRRHRLHVNVQAGRELTGKLVEVRDGDRLVGSGKLAEDFVRTDRASETVSLPMPSRQHPYGPLRVWLDGKPLAELKLPPLCDAIRWLMPLEEFVFTPCVFSTVAFPDGDFEDPTYVEDLIGPYEVRTTFYDADYNPVNRADKPGRYGAVVEVRAEDGHVFRRYCTLFREPKEVSWRNADMPVSLRFPREMGIDPAVVKEQSRSVSEYFKRLVSSEGLNHEQETGVLLAGLYEGKPGKALQRFSPLARDQKWWFGLRQKIGALDTRHAVWFPDGYAHAPHDKKWPLIVYLHSKGERGSDLELIKDNALPARLEYDKSLHLPAVVVAPQCPMNEWWSPWMINAVIDEACAKYRIDEDRIYLTGLSMGGYGAWATATEFPNRFAAIAPICGGGDPNDVERLRHLPVWVFHGGKDPIVPLWESSRMVSALKAANGNVRFTIFPEDGHDAWTHAYAMPELYSWLLQQKRGRTLAEADVPSAGGSAPGVAAPAAVNPDLPTLKQR